MNIFISKIFIENEEKTSNLKAAINVLLLSIILISAIWISLSRIGVSFDFSFIPQFKIRFVDGFFMTIIISLCSLVLSLVFGFASAFFHGSKVLLLRFGAKFYVGFIRGTPLLMQIYLFYYIIGTAVGIESKFISGILILSVFEGAYISEILRGSFLSLDSTQLEGAKAVGFSKIQTVKYVILPQMISRTLPALTGQFVSIIKDSSLLSVIALIELTQTVREITALNYKFFEGYFFLGLLYLTLTVPLSLASKSMERKFYYEN